MNIHKLWIVIQNIGIYMDMQDIVDVRVNVGFQGNIMILI